MLVYRQLEASVFTDVTVKLPVLPMLELELE
jgi:hypothetical protein